MCVCQCAYWLLLGYHPKWNGCQWLDYKQGMCNYDNCYHDNILCLSRCGIHTVSRMDTLLRWVCPDDHLICYDPLQVSISYSSRLWPWSGHMTVMVGVAQQAATFEGVAQGHVSLTVTSRPVSSILEILWV